MSQRFANTINNDPIYAARAEADQDGVNIKQYYAKIADLAAVAFSGSYNDLVNTPSIPTKTSDLTNDSGFITASDIPAIPTKTSDLTNDSGFITASDIPAQVNADWNESDPSDPAYIENKPTIPAAQVQADWNESDSSAVDYIKNKPTIPAAQVNSDWNASSGVAQILNKPDMSLYALISSLATVATTGSYLDLSNLPTISNVPTVTSSDDGKVLKASYSGGTGSYSWETAPSGLPASTSQDAGKLLGVDASGDPEWQAAPTFTQEQADWNEADTNDPAYIKNKPTIPTVDQTYNASSANAQSGTAVAGAIAGVNQVPASTSADEGKVLKVDANGDPEWGAAPASQVQADWTESDSSDPSYIQNKPVEQTLVAGTNVTITEANNQVTIGASFTQVQADWNESDTTDPSYIQNKPTIPTVELFEAVYGTTSYADIVAAITAKKIVYCKVAVSGATRMAVFAYQSDSTVEFQYYRSANAAPDSVFVYTVNSSGTWSTTERPASCVILDYGTSTWNDFWNAYQKNSVLFCRVSTGSNQYRIAHLSYMGLASTPYSAEFWFVRSIGTHTATDQCDEVYVYALKSNNTWTTTSREMVLQAVAGNGITRTVTTAAGAGTIAWSVKPATNGGVNVDSNGVSVDVKEAPSDGKEYVRKNGAWVESETVLWSGTYTGSIDPTNYITLSEAASNFSKIQVEMENGDVYTYNGSVSSFRTRYAGADKANNRIQNVDATFTVSGTTVTCTANIIYKVTSSGVSDYYNMGNIDYNPEARPVKIVGINRISS